MSPKLPEGRNLKKVAVERERAAKATAESQGNKENRPIQPHCQGVAA